MIRGSKVFLIFSLGFLLTGCSAAATAPPSRLPPLPTLARDTPTDELPTDTGVPTVLPTATRAAPAAYPTQTDSQGSVEFDVTPLNLAGPGKTLDFDVAMNTHSVDLTWDLAALSELSADTGVTVGGLRWAVGSGHHYRATLSFPSSTGEGVAIMQGATKLRLIIRDAGAPERIFEWTVIP